MPPISLLRKVRVALTVDDLLLWIGIPWATGYNPLAVARSVASAFERFGLKGVYAFSAIAPATGGPALLRVLDHWVETGHWISNHTLSRESGSARRAPVRGGHRAGAGGRRPAVNLFPREMLSVCDGQLGQHPAEVRRRREAFGRE
jgi:hypothetical protein